MADKSPPRSPNRKSKIDRLPSKVRELIAKLRVDGGRTLDEIMEKLSELDLGDKAPSRTGLGRHIQDVDQLAKMVEETRAAAETIVDRFGDAPENRTARLNIELMHGILMRLISNPDAELDPKESMFLATSIEKLAKASKLDVDREAMIRKEFQAKAEKTLGEIEDQVDQLSPRDVLKRIRTDVYGLPA